MMLGSKGLIQHAKLQPKKGLLALTGKYDGLSRTHVHAGMVGVNHSVQNHKLYSDQLTMHTCGENYKGICDCVIRNKAKGITSENRRSMCTIVTHV